MAIQPAVVVLLFALALSGIELSKCLVLNNEVSCAACQVVRGNISCPLCIPHHDFSGIKVVVKCAHVKKLATTTTRSEGSFEVELPSGTSTTTSKPLNCLAKLVGGTSQICASRKNMVSKIVKAHDSNSYTISTPLVFSTACPRPRNGNLKDIGSSKTVDLPLPREWGLAPSSYYVPFFPIIGIP